MKKIIYFAVLALIAVPIFGQDVILKDVDLYSTVTKMESASYTLRLKEVGVFERNALTSDNNILDPYPYGFRDFEPPSSPSWLDGVALDTVTIKLTFTASTDNIRVIGYNIYRDNQYIGFSDNESYMDGGDGSELEPMSTYRYNVQAVDKSKNLSVMSEDLYVTTMDEVSQISPPQFLGDPYVRYVSDTNAVIGFTTSKATSAAVEYGQTAEYGSEIMIDEYRKEHLVPITGLEPGSMYHYRVTIDDFNHNGPVESGDDSFYTMPGGDFTPPAFLHDPEASYVSNTFATITFQTDEDSLGVVQYGFTDINEYEMDELNYGEDHSITLYYLEPMTTYVFKVGITDRSGNGPIYSDTLMFTTKKDEDTEPPIIIGKPEVVYLADHMAIISWRTNELSNSEVNFGRLKGDYDRKTTSQLMTKKHLVILSNLESHVKYYFVASSTDPAGNRSADSREDFFKTRKWPDNTSPKIKRINASRHDDSASISWETDELAQSKVLYGFESGIYNFQKNSWILAQDHDVKLTGIDPEEVLFFMIIAKDPSGNEAVTVEYKLRSDIRQTHLKPGKKYKKYLGHYPDRKKGKRGQKGHKHKW